ncbi:MAG: bestrophin family protein [Myxococcota bacterium]|nr:bestrophin family ion channel [Myxococcota bacterium]
MIDYDPHDWWATFFAVRGSMLTELLSRILVCTAVAAGVAVAAEYGYEVDAPATPHTLVGVALGLLLVFRTNASYDRFWEGRKLWGGIVNASRNLVRGAAALFPRDKAYDELCLWARAFPYACMHQLRGSKAALPVGLTPAEEAQVLVAQHPPLAVALRMSRALKDARDRGLVSDIQQMQLDGLVAQLIDHVGACERIHKTPLPFAYVVHLRRALLIYCMTLPFVLVKPMHFWSVVASALIAFVLFGIEEIGVEIEDPFGKDSNDLPLESICDSIDKTLQAL